MAVIERGKRSNTILGTEEADVIRAGGGRDTVQGGQGNDEIFGENGNDVLYGGAGSDTVHGGSGDDIVVHVVGENDPAGETWDHYDGGSGNDTLRLAFTGAEWADPATQAEVLAYADFLSTASEPWTFEFTLLRMTATRFETLEIYVDGQLIDPGVQIVDLSGSTSDETVQITSASGGQVTTGSGNDTIIGGAGNDTIVSGAGNDHVYLGDGNDVVLAGSGNDTIIAGQGGGDDYIDAGPGIDTVRYDSAGTSPAVSPIFVDLRPQDHSTVPLPNMPGQTVGDLLLTNGNAADMPVGLATGADISVDVLIGVENVVGGAGSDVIIGDDVVNLLDGGAGGNDTLDGQGGADVLIGGTGDDSLLGGLDDDTIEGGAGDDTLDGGGGFDALVMTGNAADYSVQVLGNGDYSITDNGGNGDGVDTFRQVEELVFADRTVQLWTLVGPIDVFGTNGDDTLNGTGARERFFGFDGDDLITGGQEEDDFIGGSGNDTLNGGGPQDPNNQDDLNFIWDSVSYDSEYWEALNNGVTPQGVVVNLSGQSITISFGGVPLTLAAGTSKDVYGDTDTLVEIERIYGTPLGDHITGSDDDDAFDPHGGADTIHGGAGWDSLHYHLTEGAQGPGTHGIVVNFDQTVVGNGHVIDPLGLQDDFTGIEVVRGTEFGDFFYGGAGTQEFRGYAGNDVFDGGAGRDRVSYLDEVSYGAMKGINFDLSMVDSNGFAMVTDGFNDTDLIKGVEWIRGTGFADSMQGDASDNTFVARGGNDFLFGGAGADDLYGGLGNDTLEGGADSDWLEGDIGDDELKGGTGDDRLFGGFGADRFVFAAGDGFDIIEDFELFTDRLVLNGGVTIAALVESDLDGDGSLDTTVVLSSGDEIELWHINNVSSASELL